jgi:hypothetical protein
MVNLLKPEPPDVGGIKRYIQLHINDMSHRNFQCLFFMLAQKNIGLEDVFANLTELAKRIRDFAVPLSIQGLCHLLACMKQLSTDGLGVPFLCIAIGDKIRSSPALPKLRACELAAAFRGVAGFSSHLPEVQSLLDSLVAKSDECSEVLNPAQMADLLYGLQGMSNDDAAVNRLLKSFSKKLDQMAQDIPWAANDIGRSLFGIVGLQVEHDDTSAIVTVLADKVAGMVGEFSTSDISLGLFGCQALTAEHYPSRKLVEALLPHVERIQVLQPGEAGMALYGCHGIAAEHFEAGMKLREKIVALAEAAAEAPEEYGKPELYRSFLIAGCMWPLDGIPERNGPAPSRTDIEKTAMMLVQGLFMGASHEVSVELNTTLNGFDAALTVRTSEWYLNIEFDTGNHRKLLQRRFNENRDRVLKSLGYRIHRMQVEGKDWANIEAELKEVTGIAVNDEGTRRGQSHLITGYGIGSHGSRR